MEINMTQLCKGTAERTGFIQREKTTRASGPKAVDEKQKDVTESLNEVRQERRQSNLESYDDTSGDVKRGNGD
jgi:hypothetical protein